MLFELPSIASAAALTFGQLANIQTVGIGLYLALGVIQAVSSSGVAGLSRRVNVMLNAVTTRRIKTEVVNIRRLSGEVSGLEIGFHKLNRRLLIVTFWLFLASVIYFCYCQVLQEWIVRQSGLYFIIFFYLALPILIFTTTTLIIWSRCKGVSRKVDEAEKRVRKALLNL